MNWRRVLQLLGVLSSVAAIVIALPATVFAAPPVQTAHYVIFTTNRVPILNIGEVGTLTLDLQGTPSAFTFTWSFRGTTDGSPASAAGTGSGSGNASSMTLNLDTISQWSVPGFAQPETGKTASISRGPLSFFSSLYFLTLHDFPNFPHPIVTAVPLIVFPRFNGPFARGNNFFFESSAGTGSTDVSTLPGSRFPGPNFLPIFNPFGGFGR